MTKVIGTETVYRGSEYRFLHGATVRIIAVIKNAASPQPGDLDRECAYVTDDDELAKAGGVTAYDRIEVQPWIEAHGRFSFASSDPLAKDLALFDELAKTQVTK